MSELLRTVDLSYKVEQANKDLVPVGKALVSAIESVVGNENVELVIASTEQNQRGFEQSTFYKVRVYNTDKKPVGLFDEARNSINDVVDRDVKDWAFAVEREIENAEKEK